MGAIVSSSVAASGPVQVDGRQWMVETCVDLIGGVYCGSYLAEPSSDAAAHLAATAAALEASLPAAEIYANVASIAVAYPPVVTTVYSTADQTNAAVRDAYATATALPAVLLGAYLSTLTAGQLTALFPGANITTLQAALSAQAAILAQGLTAKGQ
jgi:hypothetical protein